jgi:hypothetical protein
VSIQPNQLSIEFTSADKALLESVTTGAEPNPVIASQAVAVAGIDNMQMMTALRVSQAITAALGGAGSVSGGANVGSGVGIFASKVSGILNFKSLVAGTGISIVDNGTFITLNVSAGGISNTDQLPEGATNLYFTNARVAAAPAVVANTAKISADGSINTHSDVHYFAPSDGQVLTWSAAHNYWTNEASAGGGAGSAVTSTFTNNSGSTIPAFTLVSQSSMGGLIPVDPSVEAQVQNIIGVTNASMANTATGTVTLSGLITNVSLSFPVETVVYLNTNGSLTSSAPDIGVGSFVSGDFIVKVGKITLNALSPSEKDLLVELEVVGQL